MTVEVEQTRHTGGDRRDISGTVVNALIGLVHGQAGEVGVAQTLALAGEGRSFSRLGDVASWSSLDEVTSLFNAAALVTGDGTIGLHIGELLLHSTEPSTEHSTEPDAFIERIRFLGSPHEVLRHIGPIMDHFETTAEARALEVADDHALIRVIPSDERVRHAHLCEMTRGVLSQIPALFGKDPALITETMCAARGGRYCLYALSWDDDAEVPKGTSAVSPSGHNRPEAVPDRPMVDAAEGTDHADDQGPSVVDVVDDAVDAVDAVDDVVDDTVEVLRAELDKMGVLIEGAFATALELLGDDVESLLSQIAARADAVVSAHQYLLMVRVRPGTPIQLHHRGLEPSEAQALAAELWREHPDQADESRLIVDIASPRRRYGRLVEFAPEGSAHPPSELRVLQLYAEYAATALDVFGVLADAKRSDATARTILSFTEALSEVTNQVDLVQLLADTVPRVTDCDDSVVYLWESGSGELVPRSRTEGTDWPDNLLRPIIPVNGAGQPVRRINHLAADHAAGSDHRHAPTTEPSQAGPPGRSPGNELTIRIDIPLIDRLINHREVMVLDGSTEDPFLRGIMNRSKTSATVVAPLFAAGEFLGVIAANFNSDTPAATIGDADLHERLSGLADQAATALQNLSLLEKVSHLAWHDVLTGLPNRRLFEDRVEQELVRSRRVGEPVCMFFVDLDHFKTVNDTLGHAAGDDLIQQVSQRLVDTVRRQDTVARVGGDEFAILLPGLSDQLAIDELAHRSLEAMSEPFYVFGVQVGTSASIGIAMAPEHGDSYDELLSMADEAMYRAKSRGRNAFQMYSRSPGESVNGPQPLDERSLYLDLLHGLERHEFFVLYQPYIDLRTSEVVGVESLVRWQHPTLGTLEPSSFISMAEKSDIIVALDTWVLAESCRQARIWLDHGLPPLRLSVNLASRDLANPALFDNIDAALDETGVDPSLLELEITERVVLDKSGPARQNIDRLRRLGVRFTIDDFGTGQSSLSRIGSFPVSTLKIDQSFVQVLGPDGDKNSLVSAIITMADRLGLDCVAEGVETSVQSRVLLQRGCTTAQGYYFSPPLPPEGIEAMMLDISRNGGLVEHDD